MRVFLLHLLDIFFIVFHTAWTLFNLTGWAWRATRRVHLITMLLTLLSWIGLGYFYGWGFCLCTEWHWKVRELLGNPITADSYVEFLVREITGLRPDPALVEGSVMVITAVALLLTVTLNSRDLLRRRKER